MKFLLLAIAIILLTLLLPAAIIFTTRFVFRYFRIKRISKKGNESISHIISEEFNNPDHPENMDAPKIRNTKRKAKKQHIAKREMFSIYPKEISQAQG